MKKAMGGTQFQYSTVMIALNRVVKLSRTVLKESVWRWALELGFPHNRQSGGISTGLLCSTIAVA
jgi:hypothetical protein